MKLQSLLLLITLLVSIIEIGRVEGSAVEPIARQVVIAAEAGPSATEVSAELSTTGGERKLVTVFVMLMDLPPGQTVTSVRDDGPGLTYSRLTFVANENAVRIELWQALSESKDFVANRVTASVNSASSIVMVVLVYTGFDPLIPLRGASGSAGTSSSPSHSYTANARVLLVGGLAFQGAGTFSAGAGYTILASSGAPRPAAVITGAVEERTGLAVVGPGAYTVDFSLETSALWALVAVGVSEKSPVVGGPHLPSALFLLAPYSIITVAVLTATLALLRRLKPGTSKR